MSEQNSLIRFDFEGQKVRTIIDENGQTWFVAKDVCDILGYRNSRKVISDHLDNDEKGVTKSYTHGGHQEMTIISESGLYTLIIRSNKPQAKIFRKWITSEVLPSIRKQGFYALTKEQLIEAKVQYYLLDDLREWEKTFPDSLWFALGKIKNFKFDPRTQFKPFWMGKIVHDLIYKRLDPDVLEYLKTHKPPPVHGQNYHQYLTDRALQKLHGLIHQLIGLTISCSSIKQLYRAAYAADGKQHYQLSFIEHYRLE